MSRFHVAKQKAEELFQHYALSIPVPVFELAGKLGIHWKGCSSGEMSSIVSDKEPQLKKEHDFDSWEDVLAYYDVKNNTFYVNENNQPITRIRFTLAHEIGHAVLHKDTGTNHFRKITLSDDISRPKSPLEVEANYFAGYLLIPDSVLKQKLIYTELMPAGEYMIQEFAKIFGVSSEAMRVRFKTFQDEHPDLWKQYRMHEKLF